MIVQKEVWKRIPLLHVYNEQMTSESPVVIFIHGFNSAKEHNLHYAYQLAEKGVRVILPDTYLHGERKENYSDMQMELAFWKIVIKTVAEVNTIFQELHLKNILTTNNIGLAGTSMGGIVTSGCLKIYDWVKTAGICMGTVSYTKFAQYQLEQFEKDGLDFPMTEKERNDIFSMLKQYDLEDKQNILNSVPIMFWHGKQDTVVPFAMTHPYFEEHGENSCSTYIVDEKAGHVVSREGMLAVTDWLVQHLA
ncbi:prolyl oligopeptidase family serine peptidase [Solibacillus sp. CAU 1738]|uniref:prolyl oligopeptidase family serine peptidase n=1 Tax=Solibacillus sp. CAU 1738 TaxID=3140363 RepID=UPI0032618692